MSSLTDIANIALEDIGARSISSIDSDDVTARKVKRRVFQVIDEVSTMRNWTRLRRTFKLVVSSSDGHGPTRFLAPKNLVSIIDSWPVKEWRLEGNEILAYSEELTIFCTVVSYDPDEWDVNFKGAVLAKLAGALTFAVTGNAQLAGQKIQMSAAEISRYIANDIYAEKNVRRQKRTSWFDGY